MRLKQMCKLKSPFFNSSVLLCYYDHLCLLQELTVHSPFVHVSIENMVGVEKMHGGSRTNRELMSNFLKYLSLLSVC